MGNVESTWQSYVCAKGRKCDLCLCLPYSPGRFSILVSTNSLEWLSHPSTTKQKRRRREQCFCLYCCCCCRPISQYHELRHFIGERLMSERLYNSLLYHERRNFIIICLIGSIWLCNSARLSEFWGVTYWEWGSTSKTIYSKGRLAVWKSFIKFVLYTSRCIYSLPRNIETHPRQYISFKRRNTYQILTTI